MKVSAGNLGVLKEAEFEVGDFTLVCGDNNTGKTYATYALYGFLTNWRHLLSVEIPKPPIEALLREGMALIEVRHFVDRVSDILKAGCERYTIYLPYVFGARADRFKETRFQVSVDDHTLSAIVKSGFERKIRGSEDNTIFAIFKDTGDFNFTISLLLNDRTGLRSIFQEAIPGVISDTIIDLLFTDVLSRPFIVSAERTGGTLFRDKLDYRPYAIPSHAPDYPMAVQDNINFIRRVEHVVKTDSFLATDHRDILDEFADIIGGAVRVADNGIVSFRPARRRVQLTLDESSSAVRSLLILGLYLRHVARPGDLLMVDEPELSLHPKNQRRIARLFARLVKLGVRVFVTTHSDYIVKELNTLIMLNHDDPYLKKLAKEEKYRPEELLNPEQVRVYMAKRAAVDDNERSVPDHILEPASIDPELGIEASSFDDTINEMNRIQEAIIWGHDG